MPPRRDPGESSSSNPVERDREQVEEDILLRDLVPPREGQARGTVDPPFQINREQLRLAIQAVIFDAYRLTGASSSQFVPPSAPSPPPPKKNELDDTLYHITKFVKLMPTLFEGGPNPLVADSFMDRVEKHINAMNLATDKLKITLATYNFVGDAEIWWKTVSHTHNLDTMTYDTFKKLYHEKYFPAPKRRELKKEFDGLKQGSMTVIEYKNKFTLLLRFTPGITKDEEGKIEKFVNGLNFIIRPIVAASEPSEYAKTVRKALVVEAESRDNKAIRESYKHNIGLSTFSEGQSSKKQKDEQSGFRGQQPVRSAPTTSVSMGSSTPNVTCFRCGQLGHYKSQCTQAQLTQVICFKCEQSGHHKSQCTQIQVSSSGCFGCGQQGHRVKDCPHRGSGLGRGGGSQQRQMQSAIVQSGFRPPPPPQPSQPAVLAQSSRPGRGASSSAPTQQSVTLGRVCRSCSITIVGRVLEFDLILLEMIGFDIILGMDWLSSFRVVIDCFRGRVSVCTPDGDCFCFVGDRCDPLTPSFYGAKGRDRQTFFLASLFADDDVEFCGVDYPEVVCDFLDVFPEDLTELPPHKAANEPSCS
ncbi:uncharacterized protein LOC132314742 [Cornus florida]|uniref:uncharacterized protein LOC132314742 n=1 Tax=Cornus florida TaxID=4283 RepID=UPI0028A107AF|nr:uncharacterized protein LOC132314742 [Cornus florida]